MAIKTWNSGLYSGTGDELVSEAPLMVSGTVYYVDSASGSDSNAGTREDIPFSTLGAAVSAASAHDVIVLLPTHDEVLTAGLTVAAAGVTIVGAGSASGVPSPTLTMNGAATLLTLSGAGCNLFGVKFEANQQANSNPTVAVSGNDCYVRGCYWELSQHDNGPGLSLTAGLAGFRIENSTFKSTATSVANRPVTGFRANVSSSYLVIDGVVVDAGTYGFSAYGINLATATTGLRGEGISLLRGADVFIEPTSTGYFNVATSSGGAQVVW